MGRKEVRTLLKQFSLVTAYAGGDDVKTSEAYTKGSTGGRDPGGPSRGQRACHVEREASRTWPPVRRAYASERRPLRFLIDQVGLFN